ncbi:MAG: AMP-binding protein, partial [Selenomonas sp.]|nr:AMP-binding protein [Selenomonas sp.]
MNKTEYQDMSKQAFEEQEKFNKTASNFAFKSVPERIYEQVKKNPDKTAVISTSKGELSYRELDRQANRVANYLQKRLGNSIKGDADNPCRDTIIGVLLE